MQDDTLYQERILALARTARAHPALDNPTHSATVNNPVCGDRVRIDLHNDGDTITAISGKIDGCALCEASAGLLYEHFAAIALSDAAATEAALAEWLASKNKDSAPPLTFPGQDAFTPVIDFPTRHRCITLPFAALSEIAAAIRR